MTETAAPQCPYCLDEGHVCEEHPDFPWEVKVEGHDGTAPGHGAGMPCLRCCSPIPEDGKTSITLAFVPDWKRAKGEAIGAGKHRPRHAPYPDELDQQFCEEDETLCYPGRPCLCCWVARTEAGESS